MKLTKREQAVMQEMRSLHFYQWAEKTCERLVEKGLLQRRQRVSLSGKPINGFALTEAGHKWNAEAVVAEVASGLGTECSNTETMAAEIVFRCRHGGDRADFDHRLPARPDWQAMIEEVKEILTDAARQPDRILTDEADCGQ